VNDPQIWTLVGVFGAVLFGMLGLVMRTMTSGFESMRLHMDGKIERLDAKIDGVEQRLEAKIDGVEQRLDARIDGVEQGLKASITHLAEVMDARLETTNHRLNALEGDLRLVKGHLLGSPAA